MASIHKHAEYVERKGAVGSYAGVSSGIAYLYKVCTANSQGTCVSTFSNIALGTAITFATDPTITTFAENPSNATPIKAAHITELRSAVNAVRTLAGLPAATWTNGTLTPGVTPIGMADAISEKN